MRGMPADPGADARVGAVTGTVRRLVIEADGGSRGNPGPAGYGGLVRDADTGELLAEVAEAVGVATNNFAEYSGLIAALRAAAEIDPEAVVEARLDSKLVVEQMSGRWQVKHPGLRPLAREAAALAAGFPRVTFSWIPRAQNSHADRLANEAMDAAAAGRPWVRKELTAAAVESAGGTLGQRPAADLVAPDGAPEAAEAVPVRFPEWMDAPAPPTTMLLLRAGQTRLSRERRLGGGAAGLDEVGDQQVAAVASRLAGRLAGRRVDVIVSGPSPACTATAEAVARALDLPVRVEEDLRETDFGAWAGLTYDEVAARWPGELQAWLASPAVAPPGGESLDATAVRVARARDRIMVRSPRRTVLVVTELMPIRALVRAALNAPATSVARIRLEPASLSWIGWYEDGSAVLGALNDTHHLG